MVAASHNTLPSARDFQRLKNNLHRQMVDVIDFSRAETMTEDELRSQLKSLAEYLCSREDVNLGGSQQDSMVHEIMDEIYGFGPLEPLMVDPEITDVLVNGPDRVLVERRGQLESTDIKFADDAHLMQFIQRLVGRAGRRIDESNPIVDARLPDGSRFNAVIPPLALCGPTVSIRRFGNRRLTMEDLIENNALAPATPIVHHARYATTVVRTLRRPRTAVAEELLTATSPTIHVLPTAGSATGPALE